MASKKAERAVVKNSKAKKMIPITGGILFVALVLFGGFYFVQYQRLQSKYAEATMTEDQRNQRTIDAVAKLINLPKDEKPTIIAVKDKDKLGNAPAVKKFFDQAQNGDIVLAYQKGDQAIIYRPGESRIVRTDNYNNFIAAANPIKLAIIAPADKQSDTEKSVYAKVLNVDVVSKQAPVAPSAVSYVADLSGNNAQAAQELASKLGLTVGQLPAEEKKPGNGASLVVVIAPPAAQ